MAILDFLYRQEKTTYYQRDIEEEFHIQRSTTTVLLQGMEKKGLIFRQISPSDARQRSVHLTDQAQELAKIAQAYFQAEEEQLRQTFSDEAYQHFTAILHFISKGDRNDKS